MAGENSVVCVVRVVSVVWGYKQLRQARQCTVWFCLRGLSVEGCVDLERSGGGGRGGR